MVVMPVIPACRSLRQENPKFKTSLGYITRPCPFLQNGFLAEVTPLCGIAKCHHMLSAEECHVTQKHKCPTGYRGKLSANLLHNCHFP